VFLTFVLWKYIQTTKENGNSFYENILKTTNAPNSDGTEEGIPAAIDWMVIAPQIPSQRYNPTVCILNMKT